jgi:hypothetical protein
MKTRLHNWASAILVIPRWLLTVKYALFALYGVVTAIAGVPTIAESVDTVYAFIWSVVFTVVAALAAFGSISEKYECLEKWAAVSMVALLSSLLVGAIELVGLGDLNRAGFTILVLIVTLLPGARGAALIVATTSRTRSWFTRKRS